MINNKSKLIYILISCIAIFPSLVSASDVLVWQGQYYTGTTFNTGTYNFNFSVYDALTGGNICFSNTTTLTTGNWGEWKTEPTGVNSACNNASQDYYLNININGVDQTPRRRLTLWTCLRNNVNVDLGIYNLTTTGFGQFAWTDLLERVSVSTPPTNTLRLYTENDSGFSVYKYKDDTGMVRQLARYNVFVVKNFYEEIIPIMSVVYDCGASGSGIPFACLANANQPSTMPAIGITIEQTPITWNKFGRVMMVGILENVNTSAWPAGSILYVSDTVDGGLTNVTPITPHLHQEMGTVLVSSATIGKIQVITRSVEDDAYGTIQSIWNIGDGTAGNKSLNFNNGFLGSLKWNPTASRNITIPDASGTMALTSSLTGNYSVGNCWIYFTGGIATSTNCTGI